MVWIGLLAGWMLLLPIIFSRFYDIIARQFTDVQSTVIQFIEWDGFFLLACLIFGFTYFRDGHARIDIVRNKFSTRTIALIEIFGIVLLLFPMCFVCMIYGFQHASIAHHFKETWWLPFAEGWMRKSIIPVGFSLLFLSGLVVLVRNIEVLVKGNGYPQPKRPEDILSNGENNNQ